MSITSTETAARSIRFSYTRSGQEVGHAYLAIFRNDLHDRPFGLMEDLHVDAAMQGGEVAQELVDAVIAAAKEANCYKLIATSRLGGTRDHIHYWYERLGFESYGVEFRMNFA